MTLCLFVVYLLSPVQFTLQKLRYTPQTIEILGDEVIIFDRDMVGLLQEGNELQHPRGIDNSVLEKRRGFLEVVALPKEEILDQKLAHWNYSLHLRPHSRGCIMPAQYRRHSAANAVPVRKPRHETEYFLEVSIPRQSRGLYDCWPLKGA
jgi:hypothetical protein